MLSYRHIYHAGNFADVVKHVVLVALLQAVTRKPSPCYFHDTHAGAGLYDLDSREAKLCHESDSGIGRVWQQPDPPAIVQSYLEVVREMNPGLSYPRFYPGSPAIARSLLRQHDRLLLTELHPRDHAQLVQQFRADKRIAIHKQDAYQGLGAFLPPAEKRGLVLIDPPYERKTEYEYVVNSLKASYVRWRQGIYALWYPIMSRSLQSRFIRACVDTGIRKQLHVEFRIGAYGQQHQFIGCGLVLVNPPWQLETTLETGLRWLCGPLQQEQSPAFSLNWLVGE